MLHFFPLFFFFTVLRAKCNAKNFADLNSFDLSSLEEEIATSGERSTDNEEIVYRNTINTPEILERNSKALYGSSTS